MAGSTTTIPGPGDDRPEEDALWLCLYGYEVSTSVKATRIGKPIGGFFLSRSTAGRPAPSDGRERDAR